MSSVARKIHMPRTAGLVLLFEVGELMGQG